MLLVKIMGLTFSLADNEAPGHNYGFDIFKFMDITEQGLTPRVQWTQWHLWII